MQNFNDNFKLNNRRTSLLIPMKYLFDCFTSTTSHWTNIMYKYLIGYSTCRLPSIIMTQKLILTYHKISHSIFNLEDKLHLKTSFDKRFTTIYGRNIV